MYKICDLESIMDVEPDYSYEMGGYDGNIENDVEFERSDNAHGSRSNGSKMTDEN